MFTSFVFANSQLYGKVNLDSKYGLPLHISSLGTLLYSCDMIKQGENNGFQINKGNKRLHLVLYM